MTSAQSAAVQAAPKRPRWSFSLLSLLLATGLAMAVISHVRTSRLLENYRAKSDALEIESRQRIHVRRMNQTNHLVWRWRVFLPEGRRYFLNVATRSGTGNEHPIDTRRMIDSTGEVIIDVFAADMISGTPYDHVYVVTIMTGYGNGGSVTSRAFHVDVPGTGFFLNFEELAKDRTLSFAPDEPVVLFRGVNAGPPRSPNDPSAEPGIIVWLDAPPADQ